MVDKNQAKKDRIRAAEPYEGYWEDSYDYIFSVMQEYFQESSGEKMLELGCGQGEFIERYAEFFEEVIAVEKDHRSRDQAMEKAYFNNIDNVEFMGDPTGEESLEPGSFDFILIGQSLQYMTEEDFQDTMAKSVELLNENGKVAVIVPHRKPGQNKYTKIFADSAGNYKSEEVGFEEFNDFAGVNRGPLALRRFSEEDFDAFDDLTVLESRVFHDVLLPDFVDRFISRDRLINLPFLRKYFGSRLMVVMEKS